MNGKLTLTKFAAPEIRDYRDEDETHLIRLIRELQSHEINYYDRMIPPGEIAGWYIDSIRKDCREYAGHIRIAARDSLPVGYCVVLTRVPNEEADELSFDYSHVSELAITKSARGESIGKALLQDAECLARAAGGKWLRVNVLAKNTIARDAYSRYGFEEHLINMEKPLK